MSQHLGVNPDPLVDAIQKLVVLAVNVNQDPVIDVTHSFLCKIIFQVEIVGAFPYFKMVGWL